VTIIAILLYRLAAESTCPDMYVFHPAYSMLNNIAISRKRIKIQDRSGFADDGNQGFPGEASNLSALSTFSG
jgi:hypothetical protein